ncbi:MAG: hypothetical protein WBW85_01320 [Terriglobales bacterium]
MISGRIGCELALLAVLCVLTIFLFPALQGPYTVVHGPVTALIASRAARRFRVSIVHSARSSVGNYLLSPLRVFPWISLASTQSRSFTLPDSTSILRC